MSDDDVLLSLRSKLARISGEQAGLQEAQAEALAEQVVGWMRNRFGGHKVYISKRTTETRDRQVLALFNGRNRDEVCRTLGISTRTFYRAIKRARR